MPDATRRSPTDQNGGVPIKVKLLLAAMGVVAVVLAVWVYNNAVTGLDQASLSKPFYVERLIPDSGSDVLRQSGVGIDLKDGYDAYLVINNITINNTATEKDPDGLLKAPSLGTVEYRPGPGRRIQALTTPRQCVDAWVWKKIDGPDHPTQISWCFNVT